MKLKNILLLSVLLCISSSQLIAQNQAPVVENVIFTQRTDDSFIVDIYYDVNDPDGDVMTITMAVSDDNGTTWDFTANNITGDIGDGITSGTNKQVVWDFGAEHPQIFGDQFKVKIIADDGGGTIVQWQDGFESYVTGSFPSNWIPDGNATDISTNYVTNAVSYEGSKSLQLYGIVGGCWASIAYRPLTVSSPFEIQVAIRNGNQSLSGCNPDRVKIGLRKGLSWINPARTFVQFKGNGTIESGGGGVSLGTYSTLTWYIVRIRYERPSSTTVKLSYWINGTYKGYETLAAISEEDQLTNLELSVLEGTAWFDRILLEK